MTSAVPTPDPAVGGSAPAPAEQQTNINPGTGQPYPPMGVPVNQPDDSSDPSTVAGDDVYMSLSWSNVSKEDALKIRDAAVAAAPDLSSYSVSFSTPIDGD